MLSMKIPSKEPVRICLPSAFPDSQLATVSRRSAWRYTIACLAITIVMMLANPAPVHAQLTLANPHWNITLTDFGYSDFLLDNTPGFEGREYLSGEWGAAVAYESGGNTVAPQWLEPHFIFPDWTTDSTFGVLTPLTQIGLNSDSLPIAQSVITNAHLEITLRHEMIDTVVGTPMGTQAASSAGSGTSISSSRYVLKQTCTVKNISGAPILNLQLFQFLHGLNAQRGVYDNRTYTGPLSEFNFDVTLAGVDIWATGTNSSSAGLEDYLGFHASIAPSAFEIGRYGIEGNGIDDHSIGKPSDGVHLSIENNWQSAPYNTRQGTDYFAPTQRWVSGAERWNLGGLAPGQSASLDVILSLRTGTRVTVGTNSSGGCNGGSGVTGGEDYSFDDVSSSGSCFGGYSKADANEVSLRVAQGEFDPINFLTPGGPVQLWKMEFTGTFSGAAHLTFGYDQTVLPAGFNQSSLSVYQFDGGVWKKLSSSVDATRHTITVATTNLSTFALGVDNGLAFNVSTSVLPIDGGTVVGDGTFADGSLATLIATANDGFVFSGWTQNGANVSSSPNYNFIVHSNRTLVANFTAVGGDQAVTTSALPAEGGTTTGDGVYPLGASATVVATANAGFKFSAWTQNGVTVSTSRTNTFTVTGNHALVAKFKPVYIVSVTPTPASGGELEVDPFYEPGDLCKLKANPNSGYCFVKWTQNGTQVSTDPRYQFIVTGNRSLIGHFALGKRIDGLALPAQAGYVSGGGVYQTGSNVTLIATANPGYAFLNWTDNGNQVGTSTSFSFTCTSNRTVTANFVAAAPSGFTIAANVSPANSGTITGTGNYNSGAIVTLTATPNAGFSFLNWTEGGSQVSASASYMFPCSANRTLVANFITNAAPLAFGGTFYQLPGTPLAINVADLMAFDYDPDGDAIKLAGVSATTTNGLSLTTNTTQIVVPANSTADWFSYTISDGRGGTCVGSAQISITNTPMARVLSIDFYPDGSASPSGAGVPWYPYLLQRSTNAGFTGTLQTWPLQAAPDGWIGAYDDFLDLGGQPQKAFYRLIYAP